MANVISYTTDCPECKKLGVESKLGFYMDQGKILCGSDVPHEFAEMPDETTPVLEEKTSDETNKLALVNVSDVAGMERETDAVSGQSRMQEIMAQRAPQPTVQVAAKPALLAVKPAAQPVRTAGGSSVPITASAGLGQVVTLPGGDALCGVRVSEAWVSAMQAIGEESNPARSVAEVLQEYVDQGLLEWFATPMQSK